MLCSTLRRTFAVAALACGLGFSAPASAATLVTTTVTGTIGTGTDISGLLFAPGTDLAGKGFTMVQQFSPAFVFPGGTPTNGNVAAIGFSISTRLTIAGASAPFEATSTFGVFFPGAAPGGTFLSVSVSGPSGGIDLGGTNANLVQAVDGIITDATMLQTFSLTGPFVDPDDGPEVSFDAYSFDGVNTPELLLRFRVQGRDVTLASADVTQVPEPVGLAVLSIGVAGLVAARRRRPA